MTAPNPRKPETLKPPLNPVDAAQRILYDSHRGQADSPMGEQEWSDKYAEATNNEIVADLAKRFNEPDKPN